MLLALSLLVTPPEPIAVEVTGMAPQIALAEQTARKEGWARHCAGRAGEETVLRFTLPAGWSEDRVEAALGGRAPYVSGVSFYHAGEALRATCDREPIVMRAAPTSVLLIGTMAALSPLVAVARSCGFLQAYVRDWKEGDIPGVDKPRPDFKTLDAGENTVPHYGPVICFVQMRGRKP
ncbi:hypothetical protein HZY97_06620 [Sphingomonas sp. R-74633]|uniref:hypothetical protein n=1 Tax=Sphingomonas sp. R-74633 TaxID=2751188 RepID=UPI0015D35852|nr:hypothetical protein [Sphingomonas sp. R-74633]NYT40422.1 hypothetical protein [Sphingomonas sp. R-74633]